MSLIQGWKVWSGFLLTSLKQVCNIAAKWIEQPSCTFYNPHSNLSCIKINKVARFFFLGGKTRSIAVQLILQQCCKTSRMFFVARVTVDRYWNVTAKSIMAHNKVPMTLFYWSLLGRNCQPNLFLVDSKIRYITLLQTIPVPSSHSKALFVWDNIQLLSCLDMAWTNNTTFF